ncbi:MAG: spermidine synthase [Deltaproteobacteria bacterium]|nr:spermidine synthase [Deltaproteobacteria bacterium]MBN2672674.1 spermidine synthase [Deltaproteobacteria bacterium]
MKPWTTLDEQQTPDGLLQLLRRGKKDFIIKLDNQILMNSHLSLTEQALAESAIALLPNKVGAQVLVSGLGMGYTLRAALNALPGKCAVQVAELNPIVVEWCKGELGELTDFPLRDKRVKVAVKDVSEVIMDAAYISKKPFDAIILDLYEGTTEANRDDTHPFYGFEALTRTRDALSKNGVFAVWTEGEDLGFERRLGRAGFTVERTKPGKGGPRHVVYLARPGKRK